MMKSTRGALLALAALALALAGCARPATQAAPVTQQPAAAAPTSAPATASAATPGRAMMPFTFAVPERNLNYIVPIAAARLGYFDEAGLDVRVEGMPANLSTAAMQRGDLQISGAGGSAVRAAVQGAPLRLVSFMTVRPTFYLYTLPELRTVGDLVGRRIGVSAVAGTQQYFTEMYARQQGLDPSQIVFASMGPNPRQSLAAMAAGALDGAVFDPATAALAESQGYYLLKSLGEVAAEPFQGLVASEDYIQQHPAEVRGFLKGIVRGLLYAKQNPREVAAIAREELGGEMDAAMALRAVQLYTDAISADAPGYADEKLLAAFYEYDVRIPLDIPATEPLPVLHDFRYLLEAYDALGIPRPK